jgi:hypothetical protein
VQLVGQFVRHLWGEAQPFASGRELQSMAFADEDDLVPDLITDGDLVGSVAMDVRTHCLPLHCASPSKALITRRGSETLS